MAWDFDKAKVKPMEERLAQPIKKFVVTMSVTKDVQVVVSAVDKDMAARIARDMATMENQHERGYESPHDTGEKTFFLEESIYDLAATADCLEGEVQLVWRKDDNG